MSIHIVDFKTSFKVRRNLIESSDLIFYICCTNNEINKLQEKMKIGMNDYHDDYNLLHFYDKYQRKCVNITFNKNIKENDSSKSDNSLKSTTCDSDSMRSSIFSNILLIGNSQYLKLPTQNEEFIFYLLEKENKSNDFTILNESISASSVSSFRFKLNELPLKIFIYNLNKKLTYQCENELNQNKKLAYLDENIHFSDQPSDQESLIEENEDEEENLSIEETNNCKNNNNNVDIVFDEQFSLLNETNTNKKI